MENLLYGHDEQNNTIIWWKELKSLLILLLQQAACSMPQYTMLALLFPQPYNAFNCNKFSWMLARSQFNRMMLIIMPLRNVSFSSIFWILFPFFLAWHPKKLYKRPFTSASEEKKEAKYPIRCVENTMTTIASLVNCFEVVLNSDSKPNKCVGEKQIFLIQKYHSVI